MQRRARYASIIRMGGGKSVARARRTEGGARIKMQTFDSVLDGLMPRPIRGAAAG